MVVENACGRLKGRRRCLLKCITDIVARVGCINSAYERMDLTGVEVYLVDAEYEEL